MWQIKWDGENKGQHLYNIQRTVGNERRIFGNRKEDRIISRHGIGHIALNQSLFIIGKHESGLCVKCDLPETVEHILIKCKGYDNERLQLTEALNIEINQISLQKLLNKDVTIEMFHRLIKYLKDAELINRI